MVEWFPSSDWHGDLLGVTVILTAFATVGASLALITGGQASRRLAGFLFTAGLTALAAALEWAIMISPRTDLALQGVFEVAVVLWPLFYLSFVSFTFGWRWIQWPLMAGILICGVSLWFAGAELAYVPLNALTSAAMLLGLGSAIRRWSRSRGASRRQAGIYAIGMGCYEIPLIIWTTYLAIAPFIQVRGVIVGLLLSLVHLGMASSSLALAYGSARYNLFDIRIGIRLTITRGSLLAFFVFVFLVVSIVAENLFTDRFGTLLGAAVTAALLLAIRPLENLASRLAETAVPGVQPIQDRSHAERFEFYKEQVEIAFGDGALTPKEWVMLDRSRNRLGLSPEQATKIHSLVMGA